MSDPPTSALSDDASTNESARSVASLVCPICSTTFAPKGRQRFCGDACRHAAYRRRHRQPAVPIPDARSRRDATVYECPVCEERFVGTQYCSGCRRFARRVGPGGACPCCGETVTVEDLLAGQG